MSDALVEAEALLGELPEAVARRRLGEGLGKAIQELRNADYQIQRINALIETAGLTGFGERPIQADAMDEMVECAEAVGNALESAENAETLRGAVYEYAKDLAPAITVLERSIREHWQVLARERFQPLIGLGELLSAMNVPNDLGNRLISCGRQGQSISSASAMDLRTAVGNLLSEYDTLQAERAHEIGEDEVGDFINALADKRATLAMVTPKVREWLDDHGALDRLGITTR